MKSITPIIVTSALAAFIFIVANMVVPLVLGDDAPTEVSAVISLSLAIVTFVIAERFADYVAIVRPLEETIDKVERLADKHIGLRQSLSFELFFERAKYATKKSSIYALGGYWMAIRRDVRRGEICAYIHKIQIEKDEIVYCSYDQNGPGESYFVDGVVSNISSQALLYGKVRGKQSFQIYSLFVPAGKPPYLFGTHFQTTLNENSSIATPVVFLRVDESVLSSRDRVLNLEDSDFLDENRHLAKRHGNEELAGVLSDIDRQCDARKDNIDLSRIVEFLREGGASVKIDSTMMDEHLSDRP